MKILMTASTFPRWENDDQAPFVYHLARHLAAIGVDVLVLAPHAPNAKRHETMDGVEVYRFRYFWPERYQHLCYGAGILPNVKSSTIAKLQLPFFFMSELWTLARFVITFRPDIVHAHWLMPQGVLNAPVSKVFKVPLIMTAHGSDLFSFKKGTLNKILRKASNQATFVTVNSSATKRVAKTYYGIEKPILIPMGVAIDEFGKGSKTFLKSNFKANRPVLLTVGRLIEWKGTEFVIRAMPEILKEHPKASLVIVGEGPERQRLEQLAAKLGVTSNVIFAGKVPANTMPSVFASADIFISSSITAKDGGTEGLGVVVIEAQASGTPVIATKAGGLTDIVTDKQNGLSVKEKDPKAIASAVKLLLADKELRNQLTKNAHASAQDIFSWGKIAKDFADLYDKCLSEKGR